ncbi:hypothetical protein HanOQP8_Chr15g0554831 [Helianthus annuus]|nr:hypothetical protein HanIR_Chr15g0728781 [Helianthus annuus]KAJ0650855.1 hypothetical protein HanOQP8_Chr15g0554831 [Helianthus annuus]KAJ0829451.1 hypothetical protein HanPSC8_Chr15g0644121 [Helianthus annuus]
MRCTNCYVGCILFLPCHISAPYDACCPPTIPQTSNFIPLITISSSRSPNQEQSLVSFIQPSPNSIKSIWKRRRFTARFPRSDDDKKHGGDHQKHLSHCVPDHKKHGDDHHSFVGHDFSLRICLSFCSTCGSSSYFSCSDRSLHGINAVDKSFFYV